MLINDTYPLDRTGQADASSGIQAAVNWAINSPIARPLTLAPGRYRLDNPLLIGKLAAGGGDYQFVSNVELCGAVTSFHNGGSETELFTSYKDRPAVIIQQGRSVHLHDLLITGQNDIRGNFGSYANLARGGTFLADGVRANRYSPHAGICLDPLVGGMAAGDQYPNLGTLYVGALNSGSSGTLIERCKIERFAVGVMASPAPTRQNGEDLMVRDCHLSYNQSHVAIGQDQARNCSLVNMRGDYFEYWVNCGDYGVGTGIAPNIDGGDAFMGRFLFRFPNMTRGGFLCAGLYAESVLSLGRIMTGANRSLAGHLSGCQFNFFSLRQPVDYHGFFRAQALFSGCSFDTQGEVKAPLSLITAPYFDVVFDGCSFSAGDRDSPQLVVNDFSTFHFRDCGLGERSQGLATKFGSWVTAPTSAQFARRSVWPGARLVSGDERAPCFVSPLPHYADVGGTARTFDGAGGCVVSGCPPSYLLQLCPGDLLVDGNDFHADGQNAGVGLGYYGRVVSVDAAAGTVTLEMVPQSASADGWLLLYRLPRFHRTTSGDLTAGSATITNIVGGDDWQAGDPIRSGEDFPPGTWVKAKNGSSFTVSRPPGATRTAAPLYDAVVQTMAMTAV